MARASRPRQSIRIREPAAVGLLPPTLPLAGIDRVAGTIDLLLDDDPRRPAVGMLAASLDGAEAVLEGPIGRGFEPDLRSRHLLLVAEADAVSAVRAAAIEAVGAGHSVTLLLGAGAVRDVIPASVFPDEVELVIATTDGSLGHVGSIIDVVPEYEAWADQCFAAGDDGFLAALARLAAGRDGRMGVARLGAKRPRRTSRSALERRRRAWLQLAVELEISCALGVCLGCSRDGTDGPLRACREGPVFAASELHPSVRP